jgi:hypothetical protein
MTAIVRPGVGVRGLMVAAAALGLTVAVVRADTYWENYDPPINSSTDVGEEYFPDNCCGWVRSFGNTHGGSPIDTRRIDGATGCFVIDSTGSSWAWDEVRKSRPIDPPPGGALVVEWRVFVAVSQGWGDTCVWLAGDVNEEIVFVFRANRIYSILEEWEYLFAPDQFHSFRLESSDMASYSLWLDNEHIWDGTWSSPTGWHSTVAFGDSWTGGGSGSLTYWDYVRFGTVLRGDVNGDGNVDFDDVNPFIEALSATRSDFALAHPSWSWLAADCNHDGEVNFDDISPFTALLGGT